MPFTHALSFPAHGPPKLGIRRHWALLTHFTALNVDTHISTKLESRILVRLPLHPLIIPSCPIITAPDPSLYSLTLGWDTSSRS